MKKYRYIILLTGVTIITFTIYLFSNQSLSNSYAQLEIETIAGDEDMLENLVLKGDYHPIANVYEEFKVTGDGLQYNRDASFIERLEGFSTPEEIISLRKKQPQFMRLKSEEAQAYLMEDEMIVHASIPYTRWGIFENLLELDIYKEKTKETEHYEIEIAESFDYAVVENLYVNDENLYISILKTNFDVTGVDTEETALYVYSFHLEEGRLNDVFKIKLENNDYDNIHTLVDHDERPSEMIVMGVTIDYEEVDERLNSDEDEEFFHEIVKLGSIVKLDLATGEVDEIKLENKTDNSIPIAFNGQEIIFVTNETNGLIYHTYDLNTKSKSERLKVETDMDHISLWEFQESKLKNRQLYTFITDDYAEQSMILIINIDTMELIYQGKLEDKSTRQPLTDQEEIYFHTLEVRE